jgi:uncharacterized OsmC-like protein
MEVTATFHGGFSATVTARDHEVQVDEPETSGGTDTGPQPTDLLLVSVSSCFALALAFVARKRGVDLLGLDVTAIGRYEGLKFCEISLSISSDSPRSVVEDLLPEAKRVCYVSNTLQRQPELTVEVT